MKRKLTTLQQDRETTIRAYKREEFQVCNALRVLGVEDVQEIVLPSLFSSPSSGVSASATASVQPIQGSSLTPHSTSSVLAPPGQARTPPPLSTSSNPRGVYRRRADAEDGTEGGGVGLEDGRGRVGGRFGDGGGRRGEDSDRPQKRGRPEK